MADVVSLTTEQQQALKAFRAKYPDFNLHGAEGLRAHPAAGNDYFALMQTLGLLNGQANDSFQLQADGSLVKKPPLWKQALAVAAIPATAGIVSALTPATPFVGPLAGGPAAAGTTAATTAAVGGGAGSLLHSLLPSIIGGGAALGGAAISAHSNTEAAKIAAEQADKALAIQQQQYALQRQDTAPYRALGQGAVGNLGFLSGIAAPTPDELTQLSSTVPKTAPPALPTASTPPQPSLATLGQPSSGSSQMVQVRSPSGSIGTIPAAMLQQALAAGATQVA